VSRIESLADLIAREKHADQSHVCELVGQVLLEDARQGGPVIPWPQVLQIVDETIRLEGVVEAIRSIVEADNATPGLITLETP